MAAAAAAAAAAEAAPLRPAATCPRQWATTAWAARLRRARQLLIALLHIQDDMRSGPAQVALALLHVAVMLPLAVLPAVAPGWWLKRRRAVMVGLRLAFFALCYLRSGNSAARVLLLPPARGLAGAVRDAWRLVLGERRCTCCFPLPGFSSPQHCHRGQGSAEVVARVSAAAWWPGILCCCSAALLPACLPEFMPCSDRRQPSLFAWLPACQRASLDPLPALHRLPACIRACCLRLCSGSVCATACPPAHARSQLAALPTPLRRHEGPCAVHVFAADHPAHAAAPDG